MLTLKGIKETLPFYSFVWFYRTHLLTRLGIDAVLIYKKDIITPIASLRDVGLQQTRSLQVWVFQNLDFGYYQKTKNTKGAKKRPRLPS